MNCLVCHTPIRINRLQELLAIKEPLLCAQCQSQLQRKSLETLYEENIWISDVFGRLNQGDICLNQIFFHSLKHAISEHFNVTKEIVVKKSDVPMIYPWLEILVEDILSTLPKSALKGNKTLWITEKKSKMDEFSISII